MRELFLMDARDYSPGMPVFRRPSVRGIIIFGPKIALVHSLKYDYYKFPGGGIEEGESHQKALEREVLEEAGLAVLHDSIQPYGSVLRRFAMRPDCRTIFEQENFYYLCSVEEKILPQRLDGYEDDEKFTLEFVEPLHAVQTNRKPGHGPKNPQMLEREAGVLEMLVAEGFFGPRVTG